MGKQQKTTKPNTEKKKEEKPAPAGSKYVCDQALLKCSCGSTPGQLKVSSNLFVFLQDNLKATSKDKTIAPTFGNCSAQRNNPCSPALMEWQQVAEDVSLGEGTYFLLEKSTNQCSAGGGKITITDGKQKATVKDIKIPTADLPLATPMAVENKEVVWYLSNEVYNPVPASDRWYKVDETKKTFVQEKAGSKVLTELVPHATNPSLATHTDAKGKQTTYKKGVDTPYDYGNKKASFKDKLESIYPIYVRGGVYTNAYPTYKMFIYKGENAGDAKKKLEQDIGSGSHGNAALLMELARHTRDNNTTYYKTGGPVPPTSLNGQPEYYAMNYVITETARYRVVLDKTDTNMKTILASPYRGGVSVDPFVSGDLEGCLGIRNGTGGYFQPIANINKATYFNSLNDKLVDLMPELKNIYRTQKGKGKMAVDFDEKKEALFYVKVDPLPEIAPDTCYKPWLDAVKAKQEAWKKAQQPAAATPSFPPAQNSSGGVLKSIFGKLFMLACLSIAVASCANGSQPAHTSTDTASVSKVDTQPWTDALRNADTNRLAQLLGQHFDPNTVLGADTTVSFGDIGQLPLHIHQYTSLFYVYDYSKLVGSGLSKSVATPAAMQQIQQELSLWLIRHGASVSADAVKMWLLVKSPLSFLRQAAPASVLAQHSQDGLMAAALRGDNGSDVINYLLENKVSLQGVTDAIRKQYSRDYTVSPEILSLLVRHGYKTEDAGFSLLQYAVFMLDEKTVAAELQKGASATTPSSWFFTQDDMIDGGSEENKLSARQIAARTLAFYKERGMTGDAAYKKAQRISSLLQKSK
ncbi:DUF4280 domain-containing protein [Chitinophaga qingshengii]|uniref:DUF4280 domain-containing protein n=1 Tax=Chitinophaga qingshengii TaxID=1569794 RepID=A0ABR7TF74_9BACT|nr:DUF4280 domain-containing protein [Chitinophaga qingshengii]MBC9928942.1 DUF4280 domain-containing protein [Chitinophaga qingshengii]